MRESTIANADSSLTVLFLVSNCSAHDIGRCIHKAVQKTLSLDSMLQHPEATTQLCSSCLSTQMKRMNMVYDQQNQHG